MVLVRSQQSRFAPVLHDTSPQSWNQSQVSQTGGHASLLFEKYQITSSGDVKMIHRPM